VNKMERSPERFETTPPTRSGNGRKLLAVGVVVLLAGALAVGIWQHYSIHAQVMAAAEQQRDFVVTTATVNASRKTMSVTWPGTTEAFAKQIFMHAQAVISPSAKSISAVA
jgi:F0F1-type ATP synthase membrane subunit c/vacuolar-type H+-ATPase subunit K